MKSRIKKWLCLLLAAAMVLSNAPAVNAVEAERTYDIYPVVQQITYDGTEFTLATG